MASASPRFESLGFSVAAALTGWYLSFDPTLPSDLWWQLAAGRRIVELGRVPRTDVFSFSASGAEWTNHEWLAEAIYHLWAAAAGVESLVYWYWGLVVATALLLFALCRRLGAAAWWSFTVVAPALATASRFFEVRPHLYSFALYALLAWMLFARAGLPLWTPLLFALWANLHASALFGLGALGLALGTQLAAETIRRAHAGERPRAALVERRRDLLIAGTSAPACLLNPYGVEVLLYPFRYALDGDSPFRELAEWRPPFAAGGFQSPFLPWLIGAFVVASVVRVGFRRERPAERRALYPAVALGAATLAMTLQSARFMPLFAVSAVLVLAPLVRSPDALPLSERTARRGRGRPLHVAASLALCALALAGLLRFPWTPRAFPHLVTLEMFPVDTVDFIERNRLAGDLFNFYGWGGYLALRTEGRMRVFIDGRADTVYGERVFADYRRVQDMRPGWLETLEATGAEYFLWPTLESPQHRTLAQPERLLATGRWRRLYEDFASILLVRRGVPVPARLEPTDSAFRDLALGSRAMRTGDKAGAERHLRSALSRNPNLLAACRNLTLTLAWRGRPEEAWRTRREHCDQIFPEPEADEALRELIARRARRGRG